MAGAASVHTGIRVGHNKLRYMTGSFVAIIDVKFFCKDAGLPVAC